MNQQAVLFHLKEAKEQLDDLIREIESDSSYSIDNYRVCMGHLYHHVNTAWNGRNASPERHRECTDIDFRKWRKFPKDDDLLVG